MNVETTARAEILIKQVFALMMYELPEFNAQHEIILSFSTQTKIYDLN